MRCKWDRAVRAIYVLWYWYTLPRSAAWFAPRHARESRFFIFGHIHRAGIWHLDGRVLTNTGDYDRPRNPRALAIEGLSLTVWTIRGKADRFNFVTRPLARFDRHCPARCDD